MIRKIYELTGKLFGRLTVICEAEPQHGKRQKRWMWRVQCSCGQEFDARQDHLLNGTTQSCGCLTRERSSQVHTKHGKTRTIEYWAWFNMKRRCYSVHKGSSSYGDRGIIVCDGWRDNFIAFFDDLGLRPTPEHSIDRINNDGHYSCGQCPQCVANGWPMNCRWATPAIQAGNKRSNHLLTHNNQTLPMKDWAHRQGINPQTLFNRIHRGWTVERALTTPVQIHR